MKFKLVSFLSLILIFIPVKSYVYRVDVFNAPEKNIYLISDFHKHTKNTKNQVSDTINLAKQLDSSVIVENYDHNFIKSNNLDEKDIKSCYLGLLSYECKSQQISSFDVDFRGNLGPFLYYSNIKLGALLSDYRDALEDILKYNDSSILNSFYKETYNIIKKNLDNLEKYKNLSYIECCRNKEFLQKAQKYSKALDNKQLVFNCILCMNWGLLEARILHEIYNCKNQNIFVCVGGCHNETLEQIFTEKLGYKKTYSYGSSHKDENPKSISFKNMIKKMQFNKLVTSEDVNIKSYILLMLLTYIIAILSKSNIPYRWNKKEYLKFFSK